MSFVYIDHVSPELALDPNLPGVRNPEKEWRNADVVGIPNKINNLWLMDGAMANYYHGFVRQHIVAHKGEEDPKRLEQILDRGEQNLRFVLRKYRLEEPRRPDTAASSRRPSSRRRGRQDGEESLGVREESAESVWTPGSSR